MLAHTSDSHRYASLLNFPKSSLFFVSNNFIIFIFFSLKAKDRMWNTESWSLFQFSSRSLSPFAMSLCYSIALVPVWLNGAHGFALLLFSVSFGIFLAFFCFSFLIRFACIVVVVSHCCNLIEWKCMPKKQQGQSEQEIVESLMTIWIMGIT